MDPDSLRRASFVPVQDPTAKRRTIGAVNFRDATFLSSASPDCKWRQKHAAQVIVVWLRFWRQQKKKTTESRKNNAQISAKTESAEVLLCYDQSAEAQNTDGNNKNIEKKDRTHI